MRGSTNAGTMTTDTATALSGKQATLVPTAVTSNYGIEVWRMGPLVLVTAFSYNHGSVGTHDVNLGASVPRTKTYVVAQMSGNSSNYTGAVWMTGGTRIFKINQISVEPCYFTLIYFTDD